MECGTRRLQELVAVLIKTTTEEEMREAMGSYLHFQPALLDSDRRGERHGKNIATFQLGLFCGNTSASKLRPKFLAILSFLTFAKSTSLQTYSVPPRSAGTSHMDSQFLPGATLC